MAVKVTVNLPEAAVDAIKKMAERQGITMTEVIRNAILNEQFFRDAVNDGSKVLIESKDRKQTQQVVFH